MITELQKRTIQAIVHVFETGTPIGDYTKVTLLDGDLGHLTYGRCQTTLASGNLYLLINDYCSNVASLHAKRLRRYLEPLRECDVSLDHNLDLRRLLEKVGHDPTMIEVQDQFFNRLFWRPAVQTFQRLNLTLPLSLAVIFDSTIHGSLKHCIKLANRCLKDSDKANPFNENSWIKTYVTCRKEWLANHRRTLLRKTIYRMEAFEALMKIDNGMLQLPLRICGIVIDRGSLSVAHVPIRCATSKPPRLLYLCSSRLNGSDVKRLQRRLNIHHGQIKEDGIFGPRTHHFLLEFQTQHNLKADGIVGQATWSLLLDEPNQTSTV